MSANTHKKSRKKPPFSVYLAATFVVFFCTLSAADSIGFVPCQIDGTCAASDTLTLSDLPQLGVTDDSPIPTQDATGTLPVHIAIPAIGLDLDVQNPKTTNIDALDALLQNGPARHPDSGELGQSRNIVIFGHSSHLPIVHNKMFQAFNRVPDLKEGDTISVTGADGSEYLYSVDSVQSADTTDFTQNLITPEKELIIVTCDTLTGKSARFIMTADLVGAVNQ